MVWWRSTAGLGGGAGSGRPLAAEPGDIVYVAVAQKRQRRLMRSADMLEARVVRLFLEPDGYVTGQVVTVDGGLTLRRDHLG